MSHKLPPLKSLKVFEVTARHKSFSRAAEELCITQSAVSHQIKQLEEFFGKSLLIREKKRTALTQEGDMLLAVVSDSFQRLGAITNHLLSSENLTLKVMAQTSIAADWLAPRLASFASQYPDLELALGMESYAANFNASDYDIIIGTWPTPEGFVTQKLRHEYWFPVGTPELIDCIDSTNPESLLGLPLYSSEKTEDWNLWMQQHQIRKPVNLHLHQFELAMLAVRAALAGKGIALSCGFMVDDLIKQGALKALPQFSYELPWGHYHVHFRSNSMIGDTIEKFINWLVENVNE
ncbi:LysR substrate-binding domain-containing protein [Pseudoalteromonas rubra]|uniref:Transcriptional regulator n=1 Tax=Pseudoalteromonas rubra TaxID=43658 RepID=A0A0F4QLW8_9GAMM|nr:LysR substrate-binding domain-containing protein [Pseudoalteromonas rubra]KJZ08265.1 transcriptional regulator [Pseudoalteromonas rubra]